MSEIGGMLGEGEMDIFGEFGLDGGSDGVGQVCIEYRLKFFK